MFERQEELDLGRNWTAVKCPNVLLKRMPSRLLKWTQQNKGRQLTPDHDYEGTKRFLDDYEGIIRDDVDSAVSKQTGAASSLMKYSFATASGEGKDSENLSSMTTMFLNDPFGADARSERTKAWNSHL